MKKNKFILFLFFIFVNFHAFPRSNTSPSGGKAFGMCNSFVSQSDVSSVFHNQAGLTGINVFSLGVIYENRYLLSELTNKGLFVIIPSETGVFSIHYSSFGPLKWQESQTSISISKRLFKQITSGFQINYHTIKSPEDNSSISSLGLESGLIFEASRKTSFGIHISNPFTIPINGDKFRNRIDYRLRIGGHTCFSKMFMLSYEIEKSWKNNPKLKAGIEWEMKKDIFFRSGINLNPYSFSGGLGYKFNSLNADFAFIYHPVLGISSSISITYRLTK